METLSLYANHTEALEPGSRAPVNDTVTNKGESVGILHSKQNEVGAKVDYGRIGGSLALFQIKSRWLSSTMKGATVWTASSATAAWS